LTPNFHKSIKFYTSLDTFCSVLYIIYCNNVVAIHNNNGCNITASITNDVLPTYSRAEANNDEAEFCPLTDSEIISTARECRLTYIFDW